MFHEIGDILEVKGELVFKTVAYHRAADAIARAPFDVAAAYAAGDRAADPGRRQGDRGQDRRARRRPAAWPSTIASARRSRPASSTCSRIPGVGPKTVRLVYEELGIETPRGPAACGRGGPPARAEGACPRRPSRGSSRGSPSSSPGPRGSSSTGPRRCPTTWSRALDGTPGVRADRPGGLAPATARDDRRPRPARGDRPIRRRSSTRFTSLGAVDAVVGAGRHKASVRLLRGPQVDLMVMPPGEAGTYLVHFTGSEAHNVRLRGMARDRGWSLSEKGFLRLGEDGEPLDRRRGGAADVPRRGRGVRVPRPAVHPARAARGPGRDRGGPRRDAAGAGHPRRPPRRPAQPLGLE